MPDDEIAVTCMDGFDSVSKVRLINGTLVGGEVEGGRVPGGRSGIMARFIEECRKRGLPLNAEKSVTFFCCGVILGGELDGIRGVLRHSRGKGQRLVARSLALISQEDSSLVMLQH